MNFKSILALIAVCGTMCALHSCSKDEALVDNDERTSTTEIFDSIISIPLVAEVKDGVIGMGIDEERNQRSTFIGPGTDETKNQQAFIDFVRSEPTTFNALAQLPLEKDGKIIAIAKIKLKFKHQYSKPNEMLPLESTPHSVWVGETLLTDCHAVESSTLDIYLDRNSGIKWNEPDLMKLFVKTVEDRTLWGTKINFQFISGIEYANETENGYEFSPNGSVGGSTTTTVKAGYREIALPFVTSYTVDQMGKRYIYAHYDPNKKTCKVVVDWNNDKAKPTQPKLRPVGNLMGYTMNFPKNITNYNTKEEFSYSKDGMGWFFGKKLPYLAKITFEGDKVWRGPIRLKFGEYNATGKIPIKISRANLNDVKTVYTKSVFDKNYPVWNELWEPVEEGKTGKSYFKVNKYINCDPVYVWELKTEKGQKGGSEFRMWLGHPEMDKMAPTSKVKPSVDVFGKITYDPKRQLKYGLTNTTAAFAFELNNVYYQTADQEGVHIDGFDFKKPAPLDLHTIPELGTYLANCALNPLFSPETSKWKTSRIWNNIPNERAYISKVTYLDIKKSRNKGSNTINRIIPIITYTRENDYAGEDMEDQFKDLYNSVRNYNGTATVCGQEWDFGKLKLPSFYDFENNYIKADKYINDLRRVNTTYVKRNPDNIAFVVCGTTIADVLQRVPELENNPYPCILLMGKSDYNYLYGLHPIAPYGEPNGRMGSLIYDLAAVVAQQGSPMRNLMLIVVPDNEVPSNEISEVRNFINGEAFPCQSSNRKEILAKMVAEKDKYGKLDINYPQYQTNEGPFEMSASDIPIMGYCFYRNKEIHSHFGIYNPKSQEDGSYMLVGDKLLPNLFRTWVTTTYPLVYHDSEQVELYKTWHNIDYALYRNNIMFFDLVAKSCNTSYFTRQFSFPRTTTK